MVKSQKSAACRRRIAKIQNGATRFCTPHYSRPSSGLYTAQYTLTPSCWRSFSYTCRLCATVPRLGASSVVFHLLRRDATSDTVLIANIMDARGITGILNIIHIHDTIDVSHPCDTDDILTRPTPSRSSPSRSPLCRHHIPRHHSAPSCTPAESSAF